MGSVAAIMRRGRLRGMTAGGGVNARTRNVCSLRRDRLRRVGGATSIYDEPTFARTLDACGRRELMNDAFEISPQPADVELRLLYLGPVAGAVFFADFE